MMIYPLLPFAVTADGCSIYSHGCEEKVDAGTSPRVLITQWWYSSNDISEPSCFAYATTIFLSFARIITSKITWYGVDSVCGLLNFQILMYSFLTLDRFILLVLPALLFSNEPSVPRIHPQSRLTRMLYTKKVIALIAPSPLFKLSNKMNINCLADSLMPRLNIMS